MPIGLLKCVDFETLIAEGVGTMEDVEVRRQNVAVKVLEVVFVGGLSVEKEENDEDGDFRVSFVIF